MDEPRSPPDAAPQPLEADAPVIEVARFARRRFTGGVLASAGVGAWLAYIAGIDQRRSDLGALPWVAFGLLTLVALVAGLFFERSVRRQPGALRASREGVTATLETRRGPETLRVPREQIDSAVAGTSSVSYKLKDGRTVSAQLAPGTDPDALIRVVGLSPEQHRASLRLGTSGRVYPAGVTTLIVGGLCMAVARSIAALPWTASGRPWMALLTTPVAALLGLAVPALVAYVLFARWQSVRTTVGTDGVVIHAGLRNRFVAYDDLQSVGVSEGVLTLVVRSGPVVQLDGAGNLADVEALRARIEQAREIHARGGAPVASRALLERGERSLPDWRASLAQLTAHRAGYRDVALSTADLRGLVRDTTAALEHRVAAALALASGTDPADREAIRTAAASVASARVRVVLEGIAEGHPDDEEIEGALRADATVAAQATKS